MAKIKTFCGNKINSMQIKIKQVIGESYSTEFLIEGTKPNLLTLALPMVRKILNSFNSMRPVRKKRKEKSS